MHIPWDHILVVQDGAPLKLVYKPMNAIDASTINIHKP